MGKKLHFVVTSERGKTRSFSFSKNKIQAVLFFSMALVVGSSIGWGLSYENVVLRVKTAELQKDLHATKERNRRILAKAVREGKEQKALLGTALSELRQRSDVIESILSAVGVDIAVKESESNTGGPYASLSDSSYENLTFKVDHYLDTIQSVPLGPPVPGTITSRFGRRIDPINKRTAFHDGVDIKNRPGTKIVAPADGVVVKRGYTRGYGNFLEIDHGNNFTTRFLHMKKSLVKQGVTIKRGQVVGLLGNTGRSTGPHLHYSIKYRGKALNPMKFMRIAKYMHDAGVKAKKR